MKARTEKMLFLPYYGRSKKKIHIEVPIEMDFTEDEALRCLADRILASKKYHSSWKIADRMVIQCHTMPTIDLGNKSIYAIIAPYRSSTNFVWTPKRKLAYMQRNASAARGLLCGSIRYTHPIDDEDMRVAYDVAVEALATLIKVTRSAREKA